MSQTAFTKMVDMKKIDTSVLGRQAFRGSIDIFHGFDRDSNRWVVFDNNRNKDFTDDIRYYMPKNIPWQQNTINNATAFDYYDQGMIKTATIYFQPNLPAYKYPTEQEQKYALSLAYNELRIGYFTINNRRLKMAYFQNAGFRDTNTNPMFLLVADQDEDFPPYNPQYFQRNRYNPGSIFRYKDIAFRIIELSQGGDLVTIEVVK
jgi:hypothetical protein